VRGWDARQAAKSIPALHLTGFIYFPTCISLAGDANTLVAGCKGFNGVGCDIKVWDLRFIKHGQFLNELRGHQQDVTSCKFVNRDSSVISSSRDGTVRTWTLSKSGGENQSHINSSSGRGGYTCLDVWRCGQPETGDEQLASDDNSVFFCTGDVDGSVTVSSLSSSQNYAQTATSGVLCRSAPAPTAIEAET
jgi:WD40 repeat protein